MTDDAKKEKKGFASNGGNNGSKNGASNGNFNGGGTLSESASTLLRPKSRLGSKAGLGMGAGATLLDHPDGNGMDHSAAAIGGANGGLNEEWDNESMAGSLVNGTSGPNVNQRMMSNPSASAAAAFNGMSDFGQTGNPNIMVS